MSRIRSNNLVHPTPDHPEFTHVVYVMANSPAAPQSIARPRGSYYKIGITSNIAKRFADLQNGNPEIVCRYFSKPCSVGAVRSIENEMHFKLRHQCAPTKHAREWFALTDGGLREAIRDITQLIKQYRDRVLLRDQRAEEAARLLLTVPEGYLTASEYLAEVGAEHLTTFGLDCEDLKHYGSVLSGLARRRCLKDGVCIETKYAPTRERSDGTRGVRPTNAYPRAILAEIWQGLLAREHERKNL